MARIAQFPEFFGDIQVDPRVETVVGAGDHHHGDFIRLQIPPDLPAPLQQVRVEGFLSGPGPFYGNLDGEGIDPQFLGQWHQPFFKGLGSPAEIEDRLKQPDSVGGEVDAGVDGIGQALGIGADHPLGVLRIIGFQIDDAGQKDAIHSLPD